MNIHYGIVALTLIAYLPIAAVLLYVWGRYGKGEKRVAIARGVFLIGSFFLLGCMVIL